MTSVNICCQKQGLTLSWIPSLLGCVGCGWGGRWSRTRAGPHAGPRSSRRSHVPTQATGLACGRNQTFGVAPNRKQCFPLKKEFGFRKQCVLGLRRSPSTDFNRLPGAPSDLASGPIAAGPGREPLLGSPVGPEKKPASPGALGAARAAERPGVGVFICLLLGDPL